MESLTTDSTARAVRAEAARAGVTGNELAEALGMSRSALQRRLDGRVDWTISELRQVAGHLGVPIAALIPERVA
jgi:transcriptional regulator with XRE-family HTH domain